MDEKERKNNTKKKKRKEKKEPCVNNGRRGKHLICFFEPLTTRVKTVTTRCPLLQPHDGRRLRRGLLNLHRVQHNFF